MRAWILALLLATAALTGCLRDGEPIEPVEPTARDDGTTSSDAGQQADADNGTTEGGQGDGGNATTDGDGSGGSGADDSDDGGDGTGASEGNDGDEGSSPRKRAFNLTASVDLGYAAAFGVEWALTEEQENATPPQAPPAEDVGQTDADHCPRANVTVPPGATGFTLVIHNETVNQTQPAAGAYTIVVHPPAGAPTELRWPPQDAAQSSTIVWSTRGPANGTWSIEAEPEGPVVEQSWTIDATVDGEAVFPPVFLEFGTVC